MKIKKVLNNNAVIALNEQREDIVITGLGLAFKKHAGDELEEEKIERIFRLDSKEVSNKLTELIREIPVVYVAVAEEIITLARKRLGKPLNENIYITLTDHICFAVSRIQQGLEIKNPLRWEVRQFYKDEYKISLEALDLIEQHLGVKLPEDEAAAIALHLVNALMDEEMPRMMKIIKILQDTLNIIKYHFRIEFEDDTIYYQRLVTHLKFFAQRIVGSEMLKDDNEKLYQLVREQYSEAYQCAEKIQKYALQKHGFEVSQSEMAFLTVHIERVMNTHGL